MSREDADAMLSHLFAFAERCIRERGGFYPFAATMDSDGALTSVATYDGDDKPDANTVLEQLRLALAAKATDGARATGYCVDVTVTPPGSSRSTDAAQATIEHRDGEAVRVFLPYRRGLLGKYRFGDVFASAADAEFFGTTPAS